MSYRIGIDVGGTFTDLVLVDDAGASPMGSLHRRRPTSPSA
jgi:N-methylhydantoinase A/oxoprolinase/acetone carboxylase beta subunit